MDHKYMDKFCMKYFNALIITETATAQNRYGIEQI
jgi:hypothetical protein